MMMALGPFGWMAIVGSVSVIASLLIVAKQSAPNNDPIEDLTFRLRSPLLWSLAHPVRAILRRVR